MSINQPLIIRLAALQTVAAEKAKCIRIIRGRLREIGAEPLDLGELARLEAGHLVLSNEIASITRQLGRLQLVSK